MTAHTTRARRLLIALLSLTWIAACGASQRPLPGATEPDDAVVVIVCDVGDATLWVNGREIREVRDLDAGIALSPGTHRIELRHDDYHDVYLEVTVTARERKQLRVDMAPVLP